MKGFFLFTLLFVIFVTPYAFAQITSCPCDTAEFDNGTTGAEIVDILCPGGKVAAGNIKVFNESEVSVVRPPDGQTELGYFVFIEGGVKVCQIGEEPQGLLGFKLSDQNYENCRNGLIERCGFNINPIPTLSEWGLIAMAGALGAIGLIAAARRRKAAA